MLYKTCWSALERGQQADQPPKDDGRKPSIFSIHPSPRTGASLTSMNPSHTHIIPSHFMMVAQPLVSAGQPTQGGEACVCTIHRDHAVFRSTMVADNPPPKSRYHTTPPPPLPPPPPAGELQDVHAESQKKEERCIFDARPTCVMSCHAHPVFPLLASIRPRPPPPLSSSRQAGAVCRVHVMVLLYAVRPSPGQEKEQKKKRRTNAHGWFSVSPTRLLCPFPLLLGQAPHLRH